MTLLGYMALFGTPTLDLIFIGSREKDTFFLKLYFKIEPPNAEQKERTMGLLQGSDFVLFLLIK